MKNKTFKLKQISDSIFALEFHNAYDMGMHFLRCQEYYECPSSKFRGKNFTLIDYMEWYQKIFGDGAFTYPKDYVGYNIPFWVFDNVLDSLPIKDWNKYDQNMREVYKEMCDKTSKDFYVIGYLKNDYETFNHELAHALYTTNQKYRKEINLLINNLSKDDYSKMTSYLAKSGYTKSKFKDETQAYLSTDSPETIKRRTSADIDGKLFVETFSKYRKSLKK